MGKLQSIQVLRAVAVIAVVFSHAFATERGASGVDLFFVISGFIIARVSHDRSAAEFVTARFWRIYPLYILVAAPYVIAHLSSANLDLARIAATLTLWPIWDGAYQKPFLPPAWSLYFEVLFYAGVALWLFNRRVAGLAAAGVALIALVYPTAVTAFILSPIILEFIAGYGLARVRRFPLAAPALVVGLLLLFLPAMAFPAANMLDPGEGGVRALLVGIPAVMAVYGALGLERFFRSRLAAPLVKIGDASYSIYLVHLVPVLALATWSAGSRLLAALFLGLIVHLFIERPLATWHARRQKLRHRDQAPRPALDRSAGLTAN